MELHSVAHALQKKAGMESRQELRKEEVAVTFEKIFARKLVKELTKDSFKMGDNNNLMGTSNNLYRQHIVDTLASEIAKQRKLGMADLIDQYKSNRLQQDK